MVLFVTFDIFLTRANHGIQNTGSKVRLTFKKEHSTEQCINIQINGVALKKCTVCTYQQ